MEAGDEKKQVPDSTVDNDSGDEDSHNYKPPPEKSIKDIIQADQEDESLRKYKEALLGSNADEVIVDANDQRKVLVRSLALLVDGRDEMVLDLTKDLNELKSKPFSIKEGIQYRIRIDFHVQREIVTGLKYIQRIYRLGVPVERMTHMIGSYPPKKELQSFTTPPEDMPSSLLARGTYTVKSCFTDDDNNQHLKWEWAFELKKDWD